MNRLFQNYFFMALCLLLSTPVFGQAPCSNIDNNKISNTRDNHVFGMQSMGQSIVTDRKCFPGNKFTEFSFWAQGNSRIKFDLRIFDDETDGTNPTKAPIYLQENIMNPPTNFGGKVVVPLDPAYGKVTFDRDQTYTFLVTLTRSGGGNFIGHTTASVMDGKAYIKNGFDDTRDLRFEIKTEQDNTLAGPTTPTPTPTPVLYPQPVPFGPPAVPGSERVSSKGELILEVLFVGFKDQMPNRVDYEALWKKLDSNGALKTELESMGLTKLTVNLHKDWKDLGNNVDHYAPKVAGGYWKFGEYSADAISQLPEESYPANTILVIVNDEAKSDTYPSGLEGFEIKKSNSDLQPIGSLHVPGRTVKDLTNQQVKGLKSVIVLAPSAYADTYTTMVHEIGHAFGSNDYYPSKTTNLGTDAAPNNQYVHLLGGYGMMADSRGATRFIGYNLFRYGWLDKTRTQLLNEAGEYTLDLKKISGTSGTALIVIPDETYGKIWVVEIGQTIKKQRGDDGALLNPPTTLNTEGDRVIIYTVEGEPDDDQDLKNIRLFMRTTPTERGKHLTTAWLDAVSFKETQKVENDATLPFDMEVLSKETDGFKVKIKLKKTIDGGRYPEETFSANGSYKIVYSGGTILTYQVAASGDQFFLDDARRSLFKCPSGCGKYSITAKDGKLMMMDKKTGQSINTPPIPTFVTGAPINSSFGVSNTGKLQIIKPDGTVVWTAP